MLRRTVLIILLPFVLISCGKDNPISPHDNSTQREVFGFPDPPVSVFTGDFAAIDADVATILNGPGTGNPGTPWTYSGHNWAVASALHPVDPDEQRPVYRFLADDGETMGPEIWATLSDCEHIRFPRVAACYFASPALPFVEVTFAFQHKETLGDDWNIRVIRMQWNELNGLTDFTIENIEDIENGATYSLYPCSEEQNEIHPDIAYDPRDGDLYLVYSFGESAGVNHIYYRKGTRSTSGNWPVTWGPKIVAQKTEENSGEDDEHNGFHPRIAIGKVPWGDYDLPNNWMLGIAYTWGKHPAADPGNQGRWHVGLNYWGIDTDKLGYNFISDYGIKPLDFGDFPAGLPMLDIGPPGTSFGAIVWTQAKSDDWGNTCVVYYDTKGGHAHLHDSPGWMEECAAYPSVVVHEHDSGDYNASISYLRTDDYISSYWNPMARHLTITPQVPPPATVEVGAPIPMSTVLHGEWNGSSLGEHNLGMSCSLTTLGSYYWMVWSGYQSGGGPSDVYGRFGYTE